MRVFVLVLAAAIGFGSLAVPARAAEDGVALFTSLKCGLCHQIAGKGNKNGILDKVGAKLGADEMRQWLADPIAMAQKVKATRKPPMKKLPLTKEQTDALVTYLQTLK